MEEIFERLYISNESYCRNGDEEWTVVHACKHPCHQKAVGYTGNLSKNHPFYLDKEDDQDLYLNIIDPPVPLFMLPLFTKFLIFADKHWNGYKKLLIHCNQGESRAPSLALLFLAKCRNHISNQSFEEAKEDFIKFFPAYNPGRGIQIYLSNNWDKINQAMS